MLSGGQDSTTCLFWAKRAYDVVHAVSVRYGQRHAVELDAAQTIARIGNVASWKILDLGALAQLGGSSLVAAGEVRPTGGLQDREAPEGLPTTFVPGRNLLFLGLAASYAIQVGAKHIVTGVSQADYSGYPDCRGPFVRAMEVAVNEAMPSSARGLRIEAPLLDLDKRETVLLARDLGDECWKALGESVTCYEGARPGCGRCPACALRAAGFQAAGLVDPASEGRTRRPRVGDWSWSKDGFSYGHAFATRAQAVTHATKELGGDAFFVARVAEIRGGEDALRASFGAEELRRAAAESSNRRAWCPADAAIWADLEQRLKIAATTWASSLGVRADWYVVEDVEAINPQQLDLGSLISAASDRDR